MIYDFSRVFSPNSLFTVAFGDHGNLTWDLGAKFTVTSVQPDESPNNTVVDITDLSGTGFAPGQDLAISLRKGTDLSIPATNVVRVSGTKITCQFDLNGKNPGQYDIIVEDTETGEQAVLANGFEITAAP